MVTVTRRTKYAMLPWDEIVDRAKSANGRWILGAQAVPMSVLRTVRQGRNEKVARPDGRLVPKPGEKATLEDGTEVVDLYVRWEWTPGFEPPIANAPGVSKRQVTLPAYLAEDLRRAAAGRDEPRAEILRRTVAELAVHGTNYVPPPTPDLTFEVNDYVWERAQQRVQDAGVPFHPAFVQELRRQLRKLGKRAGPPPK
jgi:hypothetical protein